LLAIALLPWILRAAGRAAAEPVPTGYFGLWSATPLAGFPADLPAGPLGQIQASVSPPALTLAHFLSAFLGVLWAYHGWMNIAPVAEEVREPQRNIPRAFLVGISIVMFLYLGANLAYYLIIPQSEMAKMKAAETSATEDYGAGERGVDTSRS